MNQAQINYIRGELESISEEEVLFPGFLPEIPAEEKLKQKQEKAKKLLKWIESGMKISNEEYEGENIEDNIFRK